MTPPNYHIAEFNIGTLRWDFDDPRIADFANGLDHVNTVAARSPGFVWRMSDDDMAAAHHDPDGPLGGGGLRLASTLSVWEDIESLEQFVWNTVHRQFYGRKGEWFAEGQGLRLVLWHVAPGHRPGIEEAMARFRHLEAHGDSDHAFGWTGARGAYRWQSARCSAAA